MDLPLPPVIDAAPRRAVTPLQHPHLVCITVEGLATLPGTRPELHHLQQLIEAGRGYPRLPGRAELERLREHGYDIALIDRATGDPTDDGRHPALWLCDEAVRFIAGRRGPRPFALSLVLPGEAHRTERLRDLDRAVGQVLTALTDWGLDEQTRVLLGPVRRPLGG
jgi:hypothetical protein